MGFRKKKTVEWQPEFRSFFFFGEMSSGLSDLVGPLKNLLKFKINEKSCWQNKFVLQIVIKKKKKIVFQIEFENQQKSGVGSGTHSL